MTDEGEPPPLLVCQRADVPHWYVDDVPNTCAFCGAAVYHRPHALEDVPGALPICMPCFVAQVEQAAAQGEEMRFMVTERTRHEVRKLLRGKMDA